mgnify:CR=1 FL=1|jgi:UDP-glucose 4-epimerase
MKVLLTGGAGFIGSHLAEAFLQAGHRVVVVDDLSGGLRENVPPGATFYLLDICDPLLERVFEAERPQVLCHQAAQASVPRSVKDPLEDARVNVLGLLNLLQCSVRWGVEKVLYASTGGAIYGEASEVPTPEEAPPKPQSPYAAAKLAGEYYLRVFQRQHGLRWTALRYANVYGPRQRPSLEAGVVAVFMETLLKGELPTVFAYPEEPQGMGRDYVYVADVVRANLLALRAGDAQVLNVGTGMETRTMELYRAVLEALRQEGLCQERRFEQPLKGPPRQGDIRRSVLSPRKAQEVLGFRAQWDLREGLRQTLRWHLRQN